MKVRIITEIEIEDPSKVLDAARLCHFRETGDWVVPASLGTAVSWLLDDPNSVPLDCGFEINRQQAEEVVSGPEDRSAFDRAAAAWRKSRDFKAEEERFQSLVDNLETLNDDGILDELIHSTISNEGSDINNQGIEGQLRHLLAAFGWDRTERIVGEVVQAACPPDDL